MQQFILGQPTKLYVTGVADLVLVGPTGLVTPAPAYTTIELAAGVYEVSFPVASTGYYTLFAAGKAYQFEVVRKTSQMYLGDVYDATIGSWQWDKVAGVLTVVRTTGEVLATYQVTDGSDSASREKVS